MIDTTSTPSFFCDGQTDPFSVGPASWPPSEGSPGSDRQLVDRLSHEFRTPLTVIKEYAALLHDGLAGEVNQQQRHLLGVVGDRADDVTLLVDDLLDATRLEAGQLRPWRRLVSPADVLADVEPALRRKATAAGVSLSIGIDADLPDVFCDARHVGRAIVNLAIDAIGSCGENGTVRLRAAYRSGSSEATVSITDNGSGLYPENPDEEHLGNRPGKDPAVGLRGLVARELIRLSLGRIDIDREPGLGTTVSVSLPLLRREELVHRGLTRLAGRAQPGDRVALLVMAAEERLDLGCSNVVDEALQHAFASTDLALRIEPHRWLAVIGCSEDSTDSVVERAARRWEESLATAPPGLFPQLQFTPAGAWELARGIESPLQAAGNELTRRSNRPRVLLADDDRELRDRLAAQLDRLGYEVLTAGDGQAAIESAALFRPDAIVLDDRMPRLDGPEALAVLRKRPDTAETPVILHSEQPGIEHEARKLGAQGCVAKTGRLDPLTPLLRRWAAGARGMCEP